MNSKSAFTLIELLAATAIAAVLMAGVLVVVSHLGRDRQRLANHLEAASDDAVVELLRRDLTAAVSMVIDDQTGEVVIDGYSAISPSAGTPSARSAEVSYRIMQKGDGGWLVRQQQALDEGGQKPWIECVSRGVKTFVIAPEPLDVNLANPDPRAANASKRTALGNPLFHSADNNGKLTAMADCYRVRIEWSDTARSPINQLIVLR